MNGGRRLVVANLFLVGLVILHDLDHVRQGRSVAAPVAAIGLAGGAGALASLGLAALRHRVAAVASLLVGIGTALGFLAVHVLPRWSPISDAYPNLPVDGLSWASVIATMAGGLIVALAGLSELRSRVRPLPQEK